MKLKSISFFNFLNKKYFFKMEAKKKYLIQSIPKKIIK